MSRRKEPVSPSDLRDQLLAGTDAATALDQSGLLDSLKKGLAERVLGADMDYHLGMTSRPLFTYLVKQIFSGAFR